MNDDGIAKTNLIKRKSTMDTNVPGLDQDKDLDMVEMRSKRSRNQFDLIESKNTLKLSKPYFQNEDLNEMNMSQILKRVDDEDNFRNYIDTNEKYNQIFDIKQKSVYIIPIVEDDMLADLMFKKRILEVPRS